MHTDKRRLVVCCFLLAMLAGCGHKPPYEGKSAAQLKHMLKDGDADTQAQGAYGLSLLGPEAAEAVPALADALASPHSLVRQNAALALTRIGPASRAAVPALTQALRDTEWTVRRQAAMALGEIGPDAAPATPVLQRLSKDPDHLVRRAATEALAKLQVTSKQK
jgi:HEAT repeat protein